MTDSFYDALAPYYHLIYPDWEASSKRQSEALAALLNEFGIRPGARLLDAAAGIGTQALGLAVAAAGFERVERRDGAFFQPLLIGHAA